MVFINTITQILFQFPMEKSIKKYIFLVTTHLVFGIIGYSYRQFIGSLLYDVEIRILEKNEFLSNSTKILPYKDQLPTADPDVHSPIYLIQLAKLEAFIFSLLADFEKNGPLYLHPKLLESIQL